MSPTFRRNRPKKPKGTVGNLIELVVTVVVAIGLALLIQAFLVKPYRIPSVSMYPTLKVGQRILVNRLNTKPGIGDVTVFHPPAGSSYLGSECQDPNQGPGHQQACDKNTAAVSTQTFVKRVVGEPGDHLKIINGYVYRNGVKETGSYIQSCGSGDQCNLPKEFTVPAGEYYMMGDNRGDSDDSRYWGPVPQKWIIGVAIATYWPVDRIGIF